MQADQILAARRGNLAQEIDEGDPSNPLKDEADRPFGRTEIPAQVAVASPPPRPVRRKPKELPPPKRRLRVYALDPSIAKSLESVSINETTLSIPWEENLEPGPVGEYLEVVDVDPASNRLYD